MIGGTLFTHNCISQDYCLRESLGSLLGICDEIVIVDAESNDGTDDWLVDCERQDARIRVFTAKWEPRPDWRGEWLAGLANSARLRLTADYHVGLQADEVLHEDDYPHIRNAASCGESYFCPRLNFWKDTKHLVPHDRICGWNILRMGPRELPFTGDAESLLIKPDAQQSSVRIFHYGFLRRAEAQARKGIAMETAFTGTYNPVYDRMKTEGNRASFDALIESERLIPYDRTHPFIAKWWLRERGHEP